MSNGLSFSEKKIKKKRIWSFVVSVLVSLLAILTYSFFRYLIKFPGILSPSVGGIAVSVFSKEKIWNYSFLCLGISPFVHTSMIMNFILFFLHRKEIDPITLKRIKFWLYRLILIVVCVYGGLSTEGFFSSIKETLKLGNEGIVRVLLFFTTLLIIYCCFFDLLIFFFNKFGVCDVFNVFFIFYITEGLKVNFSLEWKNILGFGLILLMAFAWFVITNCKWGVPVKSNAISAVEEKKQDYLFKRNFKLDFKFNFSSFHLYNVTMLLHCLFVLIAVYFGWERLTSIREQGEGFWRTLLKGISSGEQLFFLIPKWIQPICGMNLSSFPFSWKGNIFSQDSKTWIIIPNILLFVFIRWLVIFCQRKYMDLKASEIAKNLCQRGIYINGVQPGYSTQVLIDKNLSRMVNIWFIAQLIGNVLFDNFVFKIFKSTLSFISLLNLINTKKELVQQVSTKVRYTFGY